MLDRFRALVDRFIPVIAIIAMVSGLSAQQADAAQLLEHAGMSLLETRHSQHASEGERSGEQLSASLAAPINCELHNPQCQTHCCIGYGLDFEPAGSPGTLGTSINRELQAPFPTGRQQGLVPPPPRFRLG